MAKKRSKKNPDPCPDSPTGAHHWRYLPDTKTKRCIHCKAVKIMPSSWQSALDRRRAAKK